MTPTLRAGVTVGHVVLLRDITERKRAEHDLRASVAMLAATLDSTADGILVIDGKGGIVTNQRFLDMWGIPPTARGNEVLWLVMARSQLRDPTRLLPMGPAQGPELKDTLELVDGRVFESVSKPQLIEGATPGRVWSFRDITAQRRVEEARLAQLAALQETERILAQQDRFKTQLLNIASHELNTPISALQLQLQLLKLRLGPGADDEVERGLRLLDRNIERLGVLVRDTLDVARIGDGQLRLQPQAMDLARVAAEVCQSMEGVARGKRIHLVCTAPQSILMEGDPARFTQVLFNLVSNGIKFTPAGGKVTVCVESDGTHATAEVSDSGIGITRQAMGRLFEPFAQLHDGEADVRGTGLGLYISRGIVERHGGRILCQSAGRGQGTTFRVEVPLRRQEEATAGPAAAPARTVSAGSHAPQPLAVPTVPG